MIGSNIARIDPNVTRRMMIATRFDREPGDLGLLRQRLELLNHRERNRLLIEVLESNRRVTDLSIRRDLTCTLFRKGTLDRNDMIEVRQLSEESLEGRLDLRVI
jgi:hypothetical protein